MADRGELTIEIKGLKEVAANLRGVAKELAQKILDKSVRKQVALWRDLAVALAPQSTRVREIKGNVKLVNKAGKLFTRRTTIHIPGTLKRSIVVKKIKSSAENGTEARFGLKILQKAYYWRWVEFGSINNNPPVGFLRKTFQGRADIAIHAVAGDCSKALEEYFKKNAGKKPT